MSEDWLYEKALNVINKEHNLSLDILYPYRSKITLSKAKQFGSYQIQIDLIATDDKKNILVFGEAKEFLTFQGISECAEQLILKKYLLKKYGKIELSSCKNKKINKCDQIIDKIKNYTMLNYVILGSYSGERYYNAKCDNIKCLKERLKEYSGYIASIGRCNIGIILFLSESSNYYVIKKAI